MASIISAGTTSATALNMSADTSGVLQLASNNGTVALTISTAQVVTFTNPPTATGGGSVATNTAYGTGALQSNTSGSGNTAVGYQAGYINSTGINNFYAGYQSGLNNTTGSYNTFVGWQTGGITTSTGQYNTLVGAGAGAALTTGSANTFIGFKNASNGAGYLITTGSKNVVIGGYGGNEGGLDIRTASNRIVLSDGDGNPRLHIDNNGAAYFRGIDLVIGGITPSIFRNSNAGCSGFHFTAPGAYPVDGNGALNDNVMPLGNGSYRMSVIFAGTGTISTSDGNEKQDIESLSDAELRVAKVIKGLMKKYRWKDAVAIKGDEARIHVGVIAQDIEAAFAAEGLDAHRYAMFCSDTSYRVNGQAMDKDGNWHTPETEGAVKFTRLGVRYDQVLAFLIAAM